MLPRFFATVNTAMTGAGLATATHNVAGSNVNGYEKTGNVAPTGTSTSQIGRFDDPALACAQPVRGMPLDRFPKSAPGILQVQDG